MRKSRLSQYKLIKLFIVGVTARTVAQLVSVNKSTAAYYFHRLCLLIYYNSPYLEMFDGEVAVFWLFEAKWRCLRTFLRIGKHMMCLNFFPINVNDVRLALCALAVIFGVGVGFGNEFGGICCCAACNGSRGILFDVGTDLLFA